MWKYGRLLLVVAVGLVLLPLCALSDRDENQTADLAELKKLKETDPEQYTRLYEQAKEFRKLSEAEKDRLREIDKAYHKVPLHVRQRLLEVARRYAAWVARLPEERREKLKNASDNEKLKLVRQYRQEEWIATLPKAHRELLAKREGEEREKLIRKFRRDERKIHIEWMIATRHWADLRSLANKKQRTRYPMPAKLEHFPTHIQVFVREYLIPRLSKQEREVLADAEGQGWPWYPVVLVALADCHPLALPGPVDSIVPTEAKGFTKVADLPEDVRAVLWSNGKFSKSIPAPKIVKLLEAAEGKHPQFGTAVAEVLDTKLPILNKNRRSLFQARLRRDLWNEIRAFQEQHKSKEDKRAWRDIPRHWRDAQKKRVIFEMWPTKAQDLTKPMQAFLEKLELVLTTEEKKKLKNAEGAWPEYPILIQKLADKHYLGEEVPWQTLPDFRYPPQRDFWAGVRVDRRLLKGW